MKIGFFGTPDFVCDFLDNLNNQNLKPDFIITGIDVPVGRKLLLTPPAPKLWAQAHETRVFQPLKITDEFIDELADKDYDLFVVVAYGKILPERLIKLPKYGTINVHYSLLPLYRGATPIESAILMGDTETGVTIQHMIFELDAGAILSQTKSHIEPNETAGMLRKKLNMLAQPLLIETIHNIESQIFEKKEQDSAKKTTCKKIKKSDGEISLNENPSTLYQKYKAYFGWPGIFFFKQKNQKQTRIKITEAALENNLFIIKKVIPEGKKEVSYTDFLRQE